MGTLKRSEITPHVRVVDAFNPGARGFLEVGPVVRNPGSHMVNGG